eukprot:6740882-Pyramimonas_sp.AAC.1
MCESSAVTHDAHFTFIEALVTREIGSGSAALQTVLACIASLSAGRPAMTIGCLPTSNGVLPMTSASRLSPQVHFALSYLI